MLDILLCDDEPSLRLSLSDSLRDAGHRVTVVADGSDALARIATRAIDVVVTDIRMPGADGLTVMRAALLASPRTHVILMTAFADVHDAVAALKSGAHDYLTKPFDTEELLLRIDRIARQRALERDLDEARAQLRLGTGLPLVGRSPVMMRLVDRIQTLAGSDAPVLITGESGTGKELVARTLHQLGPRKAGPFVAVNCAAFPETLLEAELFGHERGAFTGAVRRREGRFKAAHRGVLFLDEVAEIPLPAQAKLLRVLQEGAVEPLGTNTPVSVDVRILSATHRNLKERIAEGRFREDLYYRLNVLDVAIPPLRERRGDLPLLVEHFLTRLGSGQRPRISPAAWAALERHPFPGNVRELEHALEHAFVLARGGEIDLPHLPPDIVPDSAPASGEPRPVRPLAVAIKEFEREYLRSALAAAGGERTRTANLLGISRKNLWEKLRAHGLGDPEE